jgi:hypothetical protein
MGFLGRGLVRAGSRPATSLRYSCVATGLLTETVTTFGYSLMCEEHHPNELVTARRAEEAGFTHVAVVQIGPDLAPRLGRA